MKKSKKIMMANSLELRTEKIKALKEIFPEVFTEGKIDYAKFKIALGDFVEDQPERYFFTWAGKREAVKAAHIPSLLTLKPVPDASLDFETTNNLFIEGDNLEVLKLLYKSYAGKVKMIYIDPPYNTGNDFVYRDNFKQDLQSYLQQTAQLDEEGNLLLSNPETSGRYHSNWLSMMYPRLYLARNLLRDDGVIFISIDHHEIHNLRLIMGEIFGEENFINILHVRRASKNLNQQFTNLKSLNIGIEYILAYQKSAKFSWVFPYKKAKEKRKLGYWTSFYNSADRPTMRYELLGVKLNKGQWKWERKRAEKAVNNYQAFLKKYRKKIFEEQDELYYLKKYWLNTGCKQEFIKLKNKRPYYWVEPSEWQLRTTDWTDIYINDNRGKNKYGIETVKNVNAVKELIRASTDRNDVVMDFFAGSGTTAEAVLVLNKEDNSNRQFILVQLSEPVLEGSSSWKNGHKTISDVAKSRIRDTIATLKKGKEHAGDLGFKVFKLTKSNFYQWEDFDRSSSKQLLDKMELYTDPLISCWQPLDVIYEVILKKGYGLNCRVEKMLNIDFNIIYRVQEPHNKNCFYICLDEKINEKLIGTDNLELKRDTLFVCRDTALTDELLVNLSTRCRVEIL